MEIGSIVECIDDSGITCKGEIVTPVKGRLYSVLGFCKYHRGEGIYIEECSDIINVLFPNGDVKKDLAPWLKSRFVERLSPMEIKIGESIEELA